jgi:hypothetical protein
MQIRKTGTVLHALMHVVTGLDNSIFYLTVDGGVHIPGLDAKQHLAGKSGLVTGAAFAFRAL